MIAAVSCPPPDAWISRGELTPGLDEHLDRCAECRALAGMIARIDILTEPDPPRGATSHVTIVPELLPPGAMLGRYQVRRTIGAGAMGVVFEAYDLQLERLVALKLVRGLGNEIEWVRRARERLGDEARAMARVVHPNVVGIYQLVDVDGEPVIAMEYVAGPDLATWPLRRPPLSERFRVVLEAGRGIAAAHQAGVVHGDIKPANILIDAGGRAKVSDFGLSSRDDAPRRGGTPGFAAPEVVAGDPADRLADQYSFAVTAWLTLFDSWPEDAPPAADSALQRLLRRALAPVPDARFRSLDELLDALEAAHLPRPARLSASCSPGPGSRTDRRAPREVSRQRRSVAERAIHSQMRHLKRRSGAAT